MTWNTENYTVGETVHVAGSFSAGSTYITEGNYEIADVETPDYISCWHMAVWVGGTERWVDQKYVSRITDVVDPLVSAIDAKVAELQAQIDALRVARDLLA